MKKRICKVYNIIREIWIDVEFGKIKKGDRFSLFDPVRDMDGNSEFIALDDAYKDDKKCYNVKSDPVKSLKE